MQEQEEIFDISVEINRGLEPLTMTVFAYQDTSINTAHRLNFKLTRNKETLGVIIQDTDRRWRQLEGNMDQHEVDAIGAAIDASYPQQHH